MAAAKDLLHRAGTLCTSVRVAVLVVALILSTVYFAHYYQPKPYADITHVPEQKPSTTATDVDVTLHVMSRCPDAATCIALFNHVRNAVGSAVNMELEYIMRNAACPHGPLECIGNYQQLCVHKLFTRDEWWSFVVCQSDNYAMDVPGNMARCAKEVGIDEKAIETCVANGEGRAMLLESAKRAEDAGALYSCTVHIAHRPHCITESGQWEPPDCENTWMSLSLKICRMLKTPNRACTSLLANGTLPAPLPHGDAGDGMA